MKSFVDEKMQDVSDVLRSAFEYGFRCAKCGASTEDALALFEDAFAEFLSKVKEKHENETIKV
jgi:hypothetical protein